MAWSWVVYYFDIIVCSWISVVLSNHCIRAYTRIMKFSFYLKELLKKMWKHGSAEAAAADRSLNRRNLDVAIQEWARLHKDAIGGGKEDQESLAKVRCLIVCLEWKSKLEMRENKMLLYSGTITTVQNLDLK